MMCSLLGVNNNQFKIHTKEQMNQSACQHRMNKLISTQLFSFSAPSRLIEILRPVCYFLYFEGVRVKTILLLPFQTFAAKLYMSHFAYACKTERQNGISRLISELWRTLDSSLRDRLFDVTEWIFLNPLIMQTC